MWHPTFSVPRPVLNSTSGTFSFGSGGGFNRYTTDVGYISGTGNTGAGPGNGDPSVVSRGLNVTFTFARPGDISHTPVVRLTF